MSPLQTAASRTFRLAALLALSAMVLAACGGGGSGAPSSDSATVPPTTIPSPPAPAPTPSPSANVLPVIVDGGPNGLSVNTPFVSVTVCQPGTATCQTVDHVLVDSASYGLRLAASAMDPRLSLPAVLTGAGVPVGECAHFASGFAWGSVRRADIHLAGELASNLPLQVIGDSAAAFATVPSACSSTGPDFGASAGVNGILGVGVFREDCPACTVSAAPNVYFSCSTGGCRSTAMPVSSQVSNPVAAFAVDNNGLALILPNVPPGGVATLSGSLVFGIGTQSNNQLGAATVFSVNSQGNFSTRYKGVTYSASFIDSGSNAFFFADPGIPVCSGFYCPQAPLALSAVNTSSTGVSSTVNFTVEGLAAGVAAQNIGADLGVPQSFDWGLPFFFGRTVFVALTGASTPKGAGPYWAY
jgi:hypothetical protein